MTLIELASLFEARKLSVIEATGLDKDALHIYFGMTLFLLIRLAWRARGGWLAAWIAFPFMYLVAIGIMYLASYIAVVKQIGDASSGGYLLIFWQFQNPPDVIFSLIKGMVMATAIVLVGCYYGYTASGGPVGVGTATAKSMVLNIVLVHIIGMLGTLVFWGANPRAPIGG